MMATALINSTHPSEHVEPHDYMEVVFGFILLVIVCGFLARLAREGD